VLKVRYDECIQRAMPFKTWTIGNVEEDGDNATVTVTISTTGNPDGNEETIELLNVDGNWKITGESCASQLIAIF
jgi:ubiquinone biosynthesis protein COQ9